jgi:hypothetical protein
VKLLLDAMYTHVIAEQLRRRGHDVVSVQEREGLAVVSDDAVLAAARDEGRAVVTENIHDFMDLDARYRRDGKVHFGVILTTDQRFPRHAAGGIGRLVIALDDWLREHPEEAAANSLVWWL